MWVRCGGEGGRWLFPLSVGEGEGRGRRVDAGSEGQLLELGH